MTADHLPTRRHVLDIEIPRAVDDELAAMAAIVATLESITPGARSRVIRWAWSRYQGARPADGNA